MGWFTCTGFYAKWQEHSVRLISLDGITAARKNYEHNKLYSGEEVDDGTETFSKVMLYIQVLCCGYALSTAFFLLELLGALRGWLKANRFVVSSEFMFASKAPKC